MFLRQSFWISSFIITAILLYLTLNHLIKINSSYKPDASQLEDDEAVKNYLDSYFLNTKSSSKDYSFRIATGVYVESIDWLDSNSFYISGYVWQKYPKESLGKISQGFVLPEAVNLKKKFAYRYKDQWGETVGWLFEGKITQRFDFTKYPFDHKAVRLRLWHEELNQKVLLVPDLQSYDSTLAGDKFGIDPEIVLGGYTIAETFFHYRHLEYDTNFGFSGSKIPKDFPELYYNIVIKRNSTDALIINVLPLFIVIILCFSSLLSVTFDPAKREIFNFQFLEILTQCGALFFVILLAHIHLREILAGVGIVYLEYMYLAVYLAIVYVAVNAFLVVHSELKNYKLYQLIRYQDNLLPKVFFLPFFSAVALIISFYFF
ncbi:MAG: hypothetical protein H6731_03100 [Myxococcales bacterium]|nr:MAG: hypothetical protein H6731_03100 [Myxococcales bacterium]